MRSIVNQHQVQIQAYSFKKLILQRRFLVNILIFLLQYAGVMLDSFTPIKFASGIALGFVFLRGYSIFPGIFLGNFCALLSQKNTLFISFYCSMFFLIQLYFIFLCSYRFISPTLIFYQRKLFLKFIFLSLSVTLVYQFFISVVIPGYFFQRWISNVDGLLIASFALVALDAYFPQFQSFSFLKKINLFIPFMNSEMKWCSTIFFIFFLATLFNLSLFLNVISFSSLSILFIQMSFFLVFLAAAVMRKNIQW